MSVDRGTDERSDSLRTRRDIARTYLRHPSPQVMLVAVFVAIVVRSLVGGWGRGDVIVAAVTLPLIGVIEWVLHLRLLHAPEDSRRMTRFGTGSGHREHHLDPLNVGWILLAGQDAAIFALLIAGWTAVWSLPILALAGGALLGPYLTALALAYLSLAHYEWVHLMVHTRYRPKTRFYRRLAANHRLHHYRNENYWLGVTSNLGDRILRTYPADKSDVPLSDTARTLG
ncbi:MAG: sterol desaturase family protein [Acidimicrobiales bacterium]